MPREATERPAALDSCANSRSFRVIERREARARPEPLLGHLDLIRCVGNARRVAAGERDIAERYGAAERMAPGGRGGSPDDRVPLPDGLVMVEERLRVLERELEETPRHSPLALPEQRLAADEAAALLE